MLFFKIFIIVFVGISLCFSGFNFYKQYTNGEEKYNNLFKGIFYLGVVVFLLGYPPNIFKFGPDSSKEITSICDISHNRETVVALCEPDIRVSEEKIKILQKVRGRENWDLKIVEKKYESIFGVDHYEYEVEVK